MKNQNGLTLVELLAVIVILGIIAAIAVPSIGGIIDNSKKDAHIANAQQMVSGAKIAVSANSDLLPAKDSGVRYIPLEYLIDSGYLDAFSDPDGGDYSKGTTKLSDDDVIALKAAPTTSYVLITKKASIYEYSVYLLGENRHIGPELIGDIDRSKVTDNTP
ncbi:type II secretion system protein [Ferdinandcohnia quinoae]|uniref:type II secretion system protein n=1 Tax=Fredinandcohnia quinoae TaxID=2918902 RepID=UPI003D671060